MSLILNGTDNSATTPSVQGSTGGTGTGVYYPATNQVAIATNGTNALTINSTQAAAFSGNLSTLGTLGVGTASPSEQFHVQGTVNSGNVRGRIQNSSVTSSTADLLINSGTNSSYVQIASAYNSNGAITFGSNLTYGFINTAGAVPLIFGTSGTEKMRILSGGTVCIGTPGFNATYSMNILCGSGIIFQGTVDPYNPLVFTNSSAGLAGYINVSGSVTQYLSISDYRLKENITPITNALETVIKLNPVDYTWKDDGKKGQGFIAHELQEVLPQAVSLAKDAVDEKGDPSYQGVDTSFLVAMLTKAIQELNAKVDTQAAEIAALKARA